MKKLCFVISFLLANNACLAFSYAKGDPYVGIGAGVQNKHGYNGLYAPLFAGMNITTGSIYLAGEAFADTGSLPLSQKRFDRTTYGFGLSFIPGVIMAQTTLAYLRIGVATFRYNKTNDYSSGGQLGLGLQSNWSTNWDLRGEYVYTGKGIIKGFGTSQFNFFNLALVYKIH